MKLTKYYIQNAKYRVEDDNGNVIWIDIDYWGNKFKMSKENSKLKKIAKKLLKEKHQVNFAAKLLK